MDLAGVLQRSLALTSGERKRLANDAISHVRHCFTLESMCNRTMTTYREVLARTTRSD